jgi:hypothetical protein
MRRGGQDVSDVDGRKEWSSWSTLAVSLTAAVLLQIVVLGYTQEHHLCSVMRFLVLQNRRVP